MSHRLGHAVWVIAEGYIPEGRKDPIPLWSVTRRHILNNGSVDANVTITVYFANRRPARAVFGSDTGTAHKTSQVSTN
jgi:hypothetical protein